MCSGCLVCFFLGDSSCSLFELPDPRALCFRGEGLDTLERLGGWSRGFSGLCDGIGVSLVWRRWARETLAMMALAKQSLSRGSGKDRKSRRLTVCFSKGCAQTSSLVGISSS